MSFFHSLWRGLTVARTIAANLLFLIILIVILFIVFGGKGTPGLPGEFALEIDLEGALVERATPLDPVNKLLGRGVQGETVLGDIESALERAAQDDRVGAVILKTENLRSANLVQIDRLSKAIDEVKAAGKPVLALGYYFSQPQYLIASQADALYLHPMGEVLLTGLASYQPYFADLLEKLEVDVNVFRVGKFKSAVEPYLRDSISPEAATASTELLSALWSSYRTKIAGNRGIEEDAIERYIANLPEELEATGGDIARLAVEQRLVDELLTADGFNARIAQELDSDPDSIERISTRAYLADKPVELPSIGSRVGLITAVGAISSRAPEEMAGGIVAEEIIERIKTAKDDDNVKALVVHVDSPGGEVLASELIRQELELVQLAGKPVVIAMAGVAASGGYWISATADKIIADPNTITGSIGIFGVLPNLSRALGRVGINFDGVGTHPLAGGPGLTRPLSDDMSRILQSGVNQGYERFITLVARGRDLDRATVEEIAQGRVWSGARAFELGLVDELGSLEDAIADAAQLAGINDDYSVLRIDPPLTPQQLLLRQFLGNARIGGAIADASRAILAASGINMNALALTNTIANGMANGMANALSAQFPGMEELFLLQKSANGKKNLALCETCSVEW